MTDSGKEETRNVTTIKGDKIIYRTYRSGYNQIDQSQINVEEIESEPTRRFSKFWVEGKRMSLRQWRMMNRDLEILTSTAVSVIVELFYLIT